MGAGPRCKVKVYWYLEVPLDTETLQAINKLARRSYFQRLWIIQELQYANQETIIQCGEHSARWYHLSRAFFKFRAILPHTVVALATNLTTVGIEQLQNLSLGVGCTEPRDRVYALLGLFPPALARRIKPDYSVPVPLVY
jgi:hypothetical protein